MQPREITDRHSGTDNACFNFESNDIDFGVYRSVDVTDPS